MADARLREQAHRKTRPGLCVLLSGWRAWARKGEVLRTGADIPMERIREGLAQGIWQGQHHPERVDQLLALEVVAGE